MNELIELLEMSETLDALIQEEIGNLTVSEYQMLEEAGILNELKGVTTALGIARGAGRSLKGRTSRSAKAIDNVLTSGRFQKRSQIKNLTKKYGKDYDKVGQSAMKKVQSSSGPINRGEYGKAKEYADLVIGLPSSVAKDKAIARALAKKTGKVGAIAGSGAATMAIFNKLTEPEKLTFKKALDNCKSKKNARECMGDILSAMENRVRNR